MEVVRLRMLGPTAAIDLVVLLFFLRSPLPGDRLEVVEDAVLAIMRLKTAIAQTEAQVDVFAAVDESRVEASDLVEQSAANNMQAPVTAG